MGIEVTMPYIINRITLEDIKQSMPETIWYSFATCWWTHRSVDICTHPKNDLPCDPRGGMLLQTSAANFLTSAESDPSYYGKHGLDALMAAHNDNCVVSHNDNRSTCLKLWDEYNDLIDQQINAVNMPLALLQSVHDVVHVDIQEEEEERRKPRPRQERDWEGFMTRRFNSR